MTMSMRFHNSSFEVHGGGQVFSVLLFNSDDLSSNPTEICSFFLFIVWKEEKSAMKVRLGDQCNQIW